jgi:hypothetical protein
VTDDIIARHRAAHEERGTTIEVYFPPRAPFGVVDDMYDQITDLAHRVKRTGWDPSVSGHRRGFDTDETRSTTLARRISNAVGVGIGVVLLAAGASVLLLLCWAAVRWAWGVAT